MVHLYLVASLLLWSLKRLLGGRTWIRADSAVHIWWYVSAASGYISNLCLAARDGDCKALSYIFLCTSLSQLLKCGLCPPGLDTSTENSFLGELLLALGICFPAPCEGFVKSIKFCPFPAFILYKKWGMYEMTAKKMLLPFSMSLLCRNGSPLPLMWLLKLLAVSSAINQPRFCGITVADRSWAEELYKFGRQRFERHQVKQKGQG